MVDDIFKSSIHHTKNVKEKEKRGKIGTYVYRLQDRRVVFILELVSERHGDFNLDSRAEVDSRRESLSDKKMYAARDEDEVEVVKEGKSEK